MFLVMTPSNQQQLMWKNVGGCILMSSFSRTSLTLFNREILV